MTAPLGPIGSLSIIKGDNQAAPVGTELSEPVEVLLADKLTAIPMPGKVINWLVIRGNGTVFANVTQTDGDGISKQRWTLGPQVGTQRLVARWLDPTTGEAITIDTVKASALPGNAVSFEANFGPNSNPAGGNVWSVGDTVLVEYRFYDAYRNETTQCADGGSIDRVTWNSENPSVIKPLDTVRLVNGKRYAEFLAQAPSSSPVILRGDPSDACTADASAFGVSGWVR